MANHHPVVPVRRNIHDNDDPYIPDVSAEEGVACSLCGAVYHNRRWSLNGVPERKASASATPHRVICPGCRKVQEKNPGGIVTLSGGYWGIHREEILNLIRNEEKKAMGINPVERIIQMEEQHGDLVIQTTNEKLAQRLGRALHKACHGDVEYKWSADNKLARVEWSREA